MAQAVAALLSFASGTVIGSFLNVVIARYGTSGSLVHGRSMCPACQRPLRWWELVPIVSFVWLRGRCQRCQQPISVRYPIVELLMGVVVMALLTPWPQSAQQLVAAGTLVIVASILVVLAGIDLRTRTLPDFYIGLLVAAVVAQLLQSRLDLGSAAAGAGVGAGFLFVLWLVTRGQGIGLGDVKLMAPLGLLLGWPGVVVLLLLAFGVGGLVGMYLLATKQAQLKTAIAFGPFLCGAGVGLLVAPQLVTLFFSFVLV